MYVTCTSSSTSITHIFKNKQNFKKGILQKKTVKDAFVYAYKKTDAELKQKEVLYNGTTAITWYVVNLKIKFLTFFCSSYLRTEQINDKIVRKLYTANCGDARVVLSRNYQAQRLTYDHKASDPKEAKRIQDTGGFIAYNRVNGILSVTRALGDHAMKEWVVCDPYYTEVTITEKDNFLIMACDGIWDVISDQEAVDLCKAESSAQAMSDKLLNVALKKNSTDNISVMVIVF